jgi:Glu-tRNA(Gln) amidotransferase subunit E-like FAD-binding protein
LLCLHTFSVTTSLTPAVLTISHTNSHSHHREIELEYLSALANDTALHIEEVIELIDTFTISEIRERIDDIFDPLTTLLVQCGQACLKRLAGLVMSDVQGKYV